MTAAGAFYHSVIDDVINALRNPTNHEDYIVEAVLQELKKIWIRKLIMTSGGPIDQPAAPPYVQDVRDSTFNMSSSTNQGLLSDPTKVVPIRVNVPRHPPLSSLDLSASHGYFIQQGYRNFTLMVGS